jgi:CheY-like chemotaxis protein
MNLCVNASDAMPAGGRLTIATHQVVHRDSSPAADSAREERKWVRLLVRDDGTGMEDSIRERIFEPFFTTKAPGKGAGLGLSTVYGIVQQHGGRITVTSTPGAGSTFEVDFPAFSRPSEAPRPASERAPQGGPETVLVAEDDDHVRRIVSGLLERAGYAVLTAQDGEHALQLFREAAKPVDIVLMDAVMPRKSGLEAYRELVQIRPDVLVLFSSGYSTAVFPDGFFDDGEHQLLEKPYDGATLLRRIREMLDRRDR